MNAQLVSGKVSISIPAVLISIPLSDQISIDLGSHPAAGQVLPVDKTIQISGMPVHFGRAELIGNDSSLILKVTSDQIDENSSMQPYFIEPGRRKGSTTAMARAAKPAIYRFMLS